MKLFAYFSPARSALCCPRKIRLRCKNKLTLYTQTIKYFNKKALKYWIQNI